MEDAASGGDSHRSGLQFSKYTGQNSTEQIAGRYSLKLKRVLTPNRLRPVDLYNRNAERLTLFYSAS